MTDPSPSNGWVVCPACGEEGFVLRSPRYDGFVKIGEDRICAGCGHRFDDDTPPATLNPAASMFSAEDTPAPPNPFQHDERGRLCRYCTHYTVHPFRQWCALHQRDTEATETCDRFESGIAHSTDRDD